MGSKERLGDAFFRWALLAFGGVVVALVVVIGWGLLWNSREIWHRYHFSFLWTQVWDPIADQYGALPFLYGTVVSSFLSLLMAVPLGVGSAIFLTELAPRWISNVLTFLIELLAAIPSVILGLMGIFILVPAVASMQPFLKAQLGFLPFFSGTSHGLSLFTAGLILVVMVLPFIVSISRDVILSTPTNLKEAALGLGATRWEMVRLVILPYARSGIFGAVCLALGRALGETMAVTMVIGNRAKISASIFDPSYSMAAVIANEFAEATSDLHLGALSAIGVVLFFITIAVNGMARLLIARMNPTRQAAR